MKKLILISLLVLFFISSAMTEAQARTERFCSPPSYFSLSFFRQARGIGLQPHLFRNIWATGQLDYISATNDLEFRAGALYMVPKQIFIFQFFGGAGLQFTRNSGYQYPYLNLGIRFLFMFSEVIHPLERQANPKYRFGLSFSF